MAENESGVRVEVDPPLLDNPVLAFVKSYWDLKRGTRAMPSRSDIRPNEMKEYLGWILLLDVLPGTKDFRFRTVGTRITEYFLMDATGKTVSEAFAPYGEAAIKSALATYNKVVRDQIPLRVSGDAGLFGRVFLDFDAIFLPLSADGVAANMVLAAFTFDRSALLKDKAGEPRKP